MKPLYEVQPDGRWLMRFDAHMLSTFATCERLFEFEHIQNLRRKGAMSFSMACGLWWSDLMSWLYDQIAVNQRSGRNEPPNLVPYLAKAAELWRKWDIDRFAQLAPKQYEKFVGTTVGPALAFAIDAAPDFKIPLGALQMAVEYFDERAAQDARFWRVICTETAFGVLDNFLIAENSKVLVAYQGRPDVIAADPQGRLMPLDFKTRDVPNVSKLLLEFKPHPQTAGYVYCLRKLCEQLNVNRPVDRCKLIVCGRHTMPVHRKDGSSDPRFVEISVEYSQSELDEWAEQILMKATHLRQALEWHRFMMKETSCHNQYGSPCAFREVCRRPPGAIRQKILLEDYEVVQPWDTGSPADRQKLGGQT